MSNRVAPPGEQSEQPTSGGHRPGRHRSVQPFGHQLGRPGPFSGRIQRRHRGGHDLFVDAELAEFGAQRRPPERAVPVFDPDEALRVGGVVDEADLGQAVQHRLGDVVRDLLPLQRLGQPGSRAGCHGEQPQTDRLGGRDLLPLRCTSDVPAGASDPDPGSAGPGCPGIRAEDLAPTGSPSAAPPPRPGGRPSTAAICAASAARRASRSCVSTAASWDQRPMVATIQPLLGCGESGR